MKKAAHLVHHAKFKYNFNKTMRQEIEFFCKKLLLESNIAWETPIAHIIPWMPTFTSFGDYPRPLGRPQGGMQGSKRVLS
jgi:hypothetical protein